MSAASTPAPRSKSSSDSRPSSSRYSLFVPMLIFLFGAGMLAFYQVMNMEDQLDHMTQTVDKMDGRVRLAQHEKTVFLVLVKGLLHLAPKNPNAEKLVVAWDLRRMQSTQPELFNLDALPDLAPTNSPPLSPGAPTNAAPSTPAAATNSSAATSPVPSPQ